MTSDNGIHYEMAGSSAEAIIFLHYFGSSGETWRSLANRLCPHIRCVMPDLRGFGYSNTSTEALGVEDHADDIQCLISSLGLEKYVLVGHSMGGKVAMALASRRLPGLESVLLLAPSPPTPEPISDKDRAELRAMFGSANKITAHLKQLAKQPLQDSVVKQELAIQLRADRTAWNAWLDTGSRENITALTVTIEIPALIIGGALDDGITTAILTEEVAGRLPGSVMKSVADTGHLLHLEQEDWLVAAILEWLEQHSQAITKMRAPD